MDSLQVFLVKSIPQALIKDIDFENPFHREKVFVRYMWGNLAEERANYAVCLLARQQLLWWIQRREEETRDLVQ